MSADGFGEQGAQFGQAPFSGGPDDAGCEQTRHGQGAVQYGPQFGQAAPYGRTGRSTNSLAIAALCCGIGQILAGPLAGIPAVILGFMSLGQISRTGEDGRGMAITGLILGIVGLMLTVLVIILVVAVAHSITSLSLAPAG
jgi:Domain of unknown function (DUF4190)